MSSSCASTRGSRWQGGLSSEGSGTMRTTVVATALPNAASGSGASIVLELILNALAQRGHTVALCPIVYPEYATPDGADWERQLDHARSLRLELAPVISEAWRPRTSRRGLRDRLRRAWRPRPEELYPTLRDAASVRVAVESLRPDAVLVYGFEALAASRELRQPRFAATSDPPQVGLRERTLHRWRAHPRPLAIAREAAALRAALRAHRRLMREMLQDCEAVGAFGRHHADWLRRLGVECDYYRTPIADPGRPRVDDAPQWRGGRLLLVGHLRGTATLDGLRVFRKMLPHLRRELGEGGFHARIVGGYDLPAELRPLLSEPEVELAGFVNDVDSEFAAADVLLVPASVRLGVRVRILTGFAHGSCVVAHEANAEGIPELAHGENALLGNGPRTLALQVARALDDRELARRLRAGARATYERFFTPELAGAALAEPLERLAKSVHTSTRSPSSRSGA
jgi:glycosyltransferase involved in cell wall biosynthesis